MTMAAEAAAIGRVWAESNGIRFCIFSMQRVVAEMSEFLKRHAASPVMKADLKLMKDPGASEHVKTDSKPLRKTYGGCHLPWANVDGEIVKIRRNKTAITNNDHLSPAPVPIDAEAVRLIDAQESKSSPRIDKGPDFVGKNRERNDGHDIPFVQGIGEFYKRHAISSSRGTRSTEGIFSDVMARALSSTSFPESPTATSVSFTTATYLPAYLVTSSLKCSTIYRSSLSIISSHTVQKRRALETICRGERLRQSTVKR